ncbi:hypothetical protein DINM_006066 [Dirofilaria immitis]|nr:hypothetical protein [Dirofilaria immitis]
MACIRSAIYLTTDARGHLSIPCVCVCACRIGDQRVWMASDWLFIEISDAYGVSHVSSHLSNIIRQGFGRSTNSVAIKKLTRIWKILQCSCHVFLVDHVIDYL